MLRIGQVEATATQDGKYTDGSVAGGIAATRLRAAAFNAMQEELAHIVESAGLALDINDMTQVLKAIQKLTLSRANPFADIKSDGTVQTALSNLGIDRVEQLNNETKIYAGDDHSIFLSIRIDGLWGIYDPLHGFIPLGIEQGGTGARDAGGARTNLGLGNSSTKNTGTTANTVAAGDDSRFSLMLGVGQSWQNVTANRFSGTVYTNNTGKPIQVFALWNDTPPTGWGYGVGTLTFSGPYDASGLALGFLSLVVPAGDTYFMRNTNISHWWELR